MKPNTSGFRQLLRDCLDLFELQTQLISVDAQAAKSKLTRAIACGLVGIAIGSSTITVVMITAGLLISELVAMSAGIAMLIVSVVGSVIVLASLAVAALSMKAAASAMQETKSELAENMRWLKATLISPGDSPRNQLRHESYPVAGNHGAPRWANAPTYRPPSESETTLPNR